MESFSAKLAVVTGGGSGMGRGANPETAYDYALLASMAANAADRAG